MVSVLCSLMCGQLTRIKIVIHDHVKTSLFSYVEIIKCTFLTVVQSTDDFAINEDMYIHT